MHTKTLPWILLLSMLLILPVLVNSATAQTESKYYVTLAPTAPSSLMYTTVGHNWTLAFGVNWTYGADSGKPIENATAYIEVRNNQNKVVETLSLNTTTGVFSFNYSIAQANILMFTPIGLITQNGETYTTELKDSANNVNGLKAKPAAVWWDTFQVSLVSFDTNSLGKTVVTVNATYLLLPSEGLTFPAWATYSNQTFLPKTVHDATVTINGVTAIETAPGIYTTSSSILMPTTYVNVEVSQEGWTMTHTAFSFAHNANERIWTYALAFGSALTFAALILHFVISRKANNSSLKHPNLPFFGGILLAVTSIISLYWGAVGIEGMLHGFEWLTLAALGLLSFAFGIIGSIMILRRKNQASAIFAVIIPLIVNVVFVKSSLDAYQLANPWLIFVFSAFLSVISAFLISNSDEAFQNAKLQDQQALV